MIRGIRFRVKNQWDCCLNKIFEKVDVTQYYWSAEEDEIVCADGIAASPVMFCNKFMEGTEFLDKIQTDSYYVIHAILKAYREPLARPEHAVNRYEDFMRSECEFMLLCFDTTHIELYSKNFRLLENVRESCRAHKFKEIEYITDKNDFRTNFHVR